MPFNHRGGSKSIVQYSYENCDGPTRVDRIALFKKIHWNPKHGWIHGAEAIYDEMIQLREHYRQTWSRDDGQPMDEIEISERVCDEVLGKQSGYIKGLGNGPKPPKLASSDASSHRATNAELRQQLISTQSELESTRASLQSAEAKIERLQETVEANQRMMMQVFQRIAPDVFQSMAAQSSSSAPSL